MKMFNYILIIWATGGLVGTGNGASYHAHITTQEFESKSSCNDALEQLKKYSADTIKGICVTK